MTEDDFADDNDRALDVLDFEAHQLGYHAAENWETEWSELYDQEAQPWLLH